jgi:DNA-directed RNA polymerase subunit RPC12/RpoP
MMNNFRQKLIRFMIGRYGMDEMYLGLFGVWFAITLVNAFVHSVILNLLAFAALMWGLFRFLSRNHAKRRAENEKFLRLWRPVKNWLTFQRDRFRDRKTARYRKCRHCKAIVKLPNKKGKHTVRCPKCGERFDVRIL